MDTSAETRTAKGKEVSHGGQWGAVAKIDKHHQGTSKYYRVHKYQHAAELAPMEVAAGPAD